MSLAPPVLRKYPRTPHVAGSRLGSGDEDLEQIAFEHLRGREIVVEEKLDGANAAVSFGEGGRLLLQSRGHFLDGGWRERQFALFKTWAQTYRAELWERLGARYVMYGEWMYAKHTIFYDELPHYFFEFDILDTERGEFLSTRRRSELLAGVPVVSAPVLWSGRARKVDDLLALMSRSCYKSERWRERLRAACAERHVNIDLTLAQTDASLQMEGLYIKIEEGGRVAERYKYVRPSFAQAVEESGSHRAERPMIPNRLRDGADIFDS